MKRSARSLSAAPLTVLALALLPLGAPQPGAIDPVAPAAAVRQQEPAGVTEHVVVISIDGLRPDAIEEFGATTMQRLMREGTYSLEAQTILPSKTLPSHTSMVTGVEPSVHGITWNGDMTLLTGPVRVPTMFGVARESGLRTAAFFSKAKFHHLEVPGTLNHADSPFGWWGRWDATRTAHEVEEYLAEGRPNLMFVHFGEPDYAGHARGWMGPEYAQAVRDADQAVARVLAAAEAAFGTGNYTVVLTADHGGSGHGHGSADPLETTIPWITWGKGVAAGGELPAIRTVDTAATALWLLGVGVPADWAGRPVRAAFVPRAPAPAVAGMER